MKLSNYFLPILKYELIKTNTFDIHSENVAPLLNSLSFQSSKLFIITNFKKGKVIEKIFDEIENKKSSITNNFSETLFNKYDKEPILKNIYSNNNLIIYEISNI